MKILKTIFVFWLILSIQFLNTQQSVADEVVPNKAGVVIDTGTEVKTVCITFRGDSITGAQALELTNADPLFQTFPGVGKAVCSLCGVGCPGDSTCLTCMGAKFWNYYNAPKGSNKFSLSGVGAGSSLVRAGDVQGWKLGVGQKPPFISYNTICGIEVPKEKQETQTYKNNENKSSSVASVPNQKNQSLNNEPETSSVTSVPITVLGEEVTRGKEALKPKVKNVENTKKSKSPWGLSLIIFGSIGFGYLIYKAIRQNRPNM